MIPYLPNAEKPKLKVTKRLNRYSRVFPDKYVEQFVGVSDKAFVHRRGQPVIENKETGQLTFIQPIIKQLDEELNDITDSLAIEKYAPPKTRDYKKIGESDSPTE